MRRQLVVLFVIGAVSALSAQTKPAPKAPATPARPAANTPAGFIDREVDKLVALYSDGFSTSEPTLRRVTFGPVFAKDSTDAVAFFTLEGVDMTNGHEEYLALFAAGQGKGRAPGPVERLYHLVTTERVGGRWSRTLDWASAKITPGQIIVKGTRWAPGDAGCCPTQAIEVTFRTTYTLGEDLKFPHFTESERTLPGK